MLAIQVSNSNQFGLVHIREPEILDDHVLVKVNACSICGSDIKLIRGQMEGIDFPVIPGHEWSGTIVEAPSRPELAGRRVVADILQNCGGCRYCKNTLPNLCDDLLEPGLTISGAFAEYVASPLKNLYLVPDEISHEEACMIEPVAVVLYALHRMPVSDSDRVLILGGGGIGQMLLRVAKLSRPEWIALADPHPERRIMATLGGVDFPIDSGTGHLEELSEGLRGHAPPTIIFDVTGNARAFHNAVELVEKGGRVGVVGYSGRDVIPFAPSRIMVKLLDIRGVLSPTGTWPEAVKLVATKAMDVRPLITHRFSLRDFSLAFDTMAERRDGAIRVVVSPDEVPQ